MSYGKVEEKQSKIFQTFAINSICYLIYNTSQFYDTLGTLSVHTRECWGRDWNAGQFDFRAVSPS